MEIMRFNRENSRENNKGSRTMDRRFTDTKRKEVPDLTDFMNDMFFGTVKPDMKVYNLTGNEGVEDEEEDQSFEHSNRSNTSKSRMTKDQWLEEARKIVASSPSRCESPSRLVGSPRFAVAQQGRTSSSSASFLDRRDPLSRSARRQRAVDSFSGEILSKSAIHRRNKSETISPSAANSDDQTSPTSAVQKWFSNILKPQDSPPLSPQSPTANPIYDLTAPALPPRQNLPRKSRFQSEPSSPRPNSIPVSSKRTFRNSTSFPDTHMLSPPKNLIESIHRRSISSSTCLVEKLVPKSSANGLLNGGDGVKDSTLNGFLKEQRTRLREILNGEDDSKAEIVLSGPSNGTSSMVAAICYAWLLENRVRKRKGESDREECVVVPVMNVRRGRMWKQRQAAWLFYHVGLDANSLLFADEVELDNLMIDGRLSILVVGQDILRTNEEVGSQCTVLTDNYCEDAYDLLETTLLKKLLLAGILLDTKNIDASAHSSLTRDAEAVQLLLVGSNPSYRNALYDQLMQDQRDNSFLEALKQNYGKCPNESGSEHHISERRPSSISHHQQIIQNPDKKSSDLRINKTSRDSPKPEKPSALPVQAPSPTSAKGTSDAPRGKNKFFLAKWFGFGSK